MKLRFGSLATAAVLSLASLSTTQAREFSNFYVFGDSLSDGGGFAGAIGAPAAVAKFTTNPDNIWVQNLAPRYGLSTATVWSTSGGVYSANSTGNNFALGGARADQKPGVLSGPLEPMAANLPPVSEQVTSFLSRGVADGRALYAVWAGANDAFIQLRAVGVGLDPMLAVGNMQTAAAATAAQVTRLRNAGAKNIVVMGVPAIGSTPFGATLTPQGAALIDTMVSTYNATLKAAVAGSGALYVDAAAAVAAVQANPTRFGITNTTVPACGASSSLGCVPGSTSGAMTVAQAATAMFADGVHPSGVTHRIMSDWIYSTLESTGRLSMMSSVPMGRSGAQWRSIDNRMREFQNFSYAGQGLFVTGDHAPGRLDATSNWASASGEANSLTVGYEKAIAADLFGGVTLGYSRAPFDLGNNAGSIKYDEMSVSAFLSKKYGSWYANAIGTLSTLQFKTARITALGIASNTDTGSTDGLQRGIKLQGGYNLSSGNLVHGPLAGLAWEGVTVDAYQEAAGHFTAMQFGDQKRRQLRSRIGYQWHGTSAVAGQRFRPFAQISHEYQHLTDNREYTAGFIGTGSSSSVATGNRRGGYGLIAVGGTLEVSKSMNLGIGASTTLRQPGARNSSLSVTLSAPL